MPRFLIVTAVTLLALSQVTVADVTTSYDYDAIGRLIKVTWSTGEVVEYAYDAAGNRITKTVSGGNTAPAPTGTRVVVLPLSGFTIIPIQ